jgi:hypothetical protein
MKAVTVLLLCFFSAVFAHDWLILPVPFNGGVAQTATPCDSPTADYTSTNLNKGEDLLVSWGNGHHTGQHVLQVTTITSSPAVTDFKELASVTADPVNAPQYFTLKAGNFSSYTIGSKLTFRWSWTSYDNCAILVMTAAAPANSVPIPTTVTKNPVTNLPVVAGDTLITNSANQTIGTFNIYTANIVCTAGYTANGNNCVASSSSGSSSSSSGSGLSGAATFFIVLFVVVVVGIAGIAAFSHFKHGDVLHYVRGKKSSDSSKPYTAFSEQRV